MGEVVNLRRARKRKARAEDETAAAANRRLHGVPKCERTVSKAKASLEQRALDARRLAPKTGD